MLPLETNIFELYATGGLGPMTIITLILIFLFFAAWKAPAWVKEIGLAGLAFGIMWTLISFMQAGAAIHRAGDISMSVMWGGVRAILVTAVYGFIVYLISLVIRIIRKPRT